jgi:hypothetical protein
MPDIFGASGQFAIDALGNQYQQALNNAYGPSGFGGQTAYYAGVGADYGRATGGFNGVVGGGSFPDAGLANNPYLNYDDSAGLGGVYPTGSRDAIAAQLAQQPQSWGDWLRQYQVPAGPQPGEGSMSPAADAIRSYLAPTPSGADNTYGVDPGAWASMSAGDRATFNRAMGGGGGAAPQPAPQQPQSGSSWLSQYQVPAGPQPGEGSMSPAADAIRNYLAPAPSGSDNTYGVDPGAWGQMSAGDRATFNRAMGGQGAVPYTGGGIGSDAGQSPGQYQNQDPVVDWNRYFTGAASTQQAGPAAYPSSPGEGGQSLTPYGGVGAPTNGPYPNLGYNPGMQNYFAAGGGMQQYNPQQQITGLQQTLGQIGGGGQSWQALGMSPSDVQTFTRAVGQDAAEAWRNKGSQ